MFSSVVIANFPVSSVVVDGVALLVDLVPCVFWDVPAQAMFVQVVFLLRLSCRLRELDRLHQASVSKYLSRAVRNPLPNVLYASRLQWRGGDETGGPHSLFCLVYREAFSSLGASTLPQGINQFLPRYMPDILVSRIRS